MSAQHSPTLVTGATGFVGSAVARTLIDRGHRLRLLVRRGSDRSNLAGLDAELAEGDLTDPASLARAADGCRFLFHVAADYRLWVPNPAAMMRANVDGTRALLLAAQAQGVEKIVYCSSVAALGLTGTSAPADEVEAALGAPVSLAMAWSPVTKAAEAPPMLTWDSTMLAPPTVAVVSPETAVTRWPAVSEV